jgi:hypothetical protein
VFGLSAVAPTADITPVVQKGERGRQLRRPLRRTRLPVQAACRPVIGTAPLDFHFDIFQFPFRFNPGTNRGNVEIGFDK